MFMLQMILVFTVVDADIHPVWGWWKFVEVRRITYVSEVLTVFIFKANSVAILWIARLPGIRCLQDSGVGLKTNYHD
jgi:hypothetical protein